MSNLYASRVLSEHPIATWPFDADANYISLVDETDRAVDDWTLTGCTAAEYVDFDMPNTPFPDSYVTEVLAPTGVLGDYSLVVESASVWTGADIYSTIPVSASLFIHINSPSITHVDFGSTNGTLTDVTRTYFPTEGSDVWVKVSHYNLLYEQLYLKIYFLDNQSANDLTYLINGLTVGQYLEAVSSDSLGVSPVAIAGTEDVVVDGALPDDATIGLYEELAAGVAERSLYYVAKDNRLLAYNCALPMTYGSNYQTRLVPVGGEDDGTIPSVIFDGCGMFNEYGKYDNYTLEFWLRVSGSTNTPKKIFGPVETGNNDGLYMTSSVLTITIGESFASYNVGTLNDPTLVHITSSQGRMGLLINGEPVAALTYDINDDLAPWTNQWLGFWSYEDLDPIDIDCVSLFGYIIPDVVAKRRFIWGQGVSDIGVINSQYSGAGAFSDFATSKTTKSISYPDNYFWQSGFADNLSVVEEQLSVPEKELPELVLDDFTEKEWYAALYAIQGGEKYFTFKPNSDWNSGTKAARFETLSTFASACTGISITWDLAVVDEPALAVEPVFVIKSKSKDGRLIYGYVTDADTLTVSYIDGSTTTVLHEEAVDTDTKYMTYINFLGDSELNTASPNKTLIPDSMRQMLSNIADLDLTVGSYDDVVFGGRYFNVSLVGPRYYREVISDLLDDTDLVVSHVTRLPDDEYVPFDLTTYTWLPMVEYGQFYGDIGIRGTWEEYIPLSQLAGVVKDINNQDKVSVDNIQFNIGHIRPQAGEAGIGSWTLEAFDLEFAAMTYDELAAYLVSNGYTTYDELALYGGATGVTYNTEPLFVRSFISFQKSSEEIKERATLTAPGAIPTSDVYYINEVSDYLNKQYEVMDGVTIIPPKNRTPDKLVMVVYIDFAVPGIRTYPITVKSMELSALAKHRNTFTPIGSKYGKDVYPITYNGMYYDHGSVNPFRIDKRGFPYLYLGRETGFVPDAPAQIGWDKGFQVVIPEGASTEYDMDSIQFWVRRESEFSEAESKIAELLYSNQKVVFKMQAFEGDTTRGIIKAYDKYNQEYSGITFYQNGNLVTHPVIGLGHWDAIQVAFAPPGLYLLAAAGRINFYPGLVYNNMSYFATRPSLGSIQISYRGWGDINDELWNYWDEDSWSNVLIAGSVITKSKELSQIVYKTYVGTQGISVEGTQPMRLTQDSIDAYSGTQWASATLIPT